MHDWQEVRQQYGRVVFGAVYRILKRHDQALDCYQEVFLEAFQQCGDRPVRNWAALLRWLAVRRALDWLRKERRAAMRVNAVEDATRLSDVPADPAAEIEFRELVDRVRLEVARLPERQAEAFWLHCVEELSYEEVAEQLGTDTKTVAVLVHRARAGLRSMLADLNPARIARSS